MAVIHAYLDESEHQESGWFCVAGYVFEARLARRFAKEWRAVFRDRDFHATDLQSG